MNFSDNVYYDRPYQIQRILAITFSAVQLIYITRGALNYSFIIINRDPLDIWNIIDGFSNIRFYAQFLSWTLPFILAYTVVNTQEVYRKWLIGIVIASWTLVLISGTRAYVLGIVFSIMAVIWFTPRFWLTYTKWILLTGFSGLAGYFILIYLIPALLGLDNSAALNSTANRNFSSSSGRIKIWEDTLQIIMQNPLTGIGPMMTAMDGVLDKVAHPHNFPLQLAAEWGIPFATVVILSLLYASLKWHNTIAKKPAERGALALPITAATSSAMAASLVDGIIVMPVSLLYMAIIVGMGFSLWRQWSETHDWIETPRPVSYLFMGIALALISLTIHQWPPSNQIHKPSYRLEPRFWSDGKIRHNNKSYLAEINNAAAKH